MNVSVVSFSRHPGIKGDRRLAHSGIQYSSTSSYLYSDAIEDGIYIWTAIWVARCLDSSLNINFC